MSALAFVWCSFSLFILSTKMLKGDMRMNKSLRDQLKDWKKQHGVSKRIIQKKRTSSNAKKKQERLSDKDLRELMGTDRPTYARGRGGAYRQK